MMFIFKVNHGMREHNDQRHINNISYVYNGGVKYVLLQLTYQLFRNNFIVKYLYFQLLFHLVLLLLKHIEFRLCSMGRQWCGIFRSYH